jgi:prefoldin alpha subunit
MSEAGQAVNVTDLTVPQLTEVKRQLEEELTHLTNSFAQLKQAQAKFRGCIENLTQVTPNHSKTSILIPLTNSLYVPGRLTDTENVLIDIGTGFFIEKTVDQARKHYEAKVDFVRKNLETLEEAIQKKRDNLSYLVNIMQLKMQARR